MRLIVKDFMDVKSTQFTQGLGWYPLHVASWIQRRLEEEAFQKWTDEGTMLWSSWGTSRVDNECSSCANFDLCPRLDGYTSETTMLPWIILFCEFWRHNTCIVQQPMEKKIYQTELVAVPYIGTLVELGSSVIKLLISSSALATTQTSHE